MPDTHAQLRHSPLFEDVPEHLVDELLTHATMRQLERGDRLLTADTDNTSLFLVASGAVAVQFAHGTRPHLRVGPGECVGELSVTFTILTNDGQDAIVKQALDALKSATQEPTA